MMHKKQNLLFKNWLMLLYALLPWRTSLIRHYRYMEQQSNTMYNGITMKLLFVICTIKYFYSTSCTIYESMNLWNPLPVLPLDLAMEFNKTSCICLWKYWYRDTCTYYRSLLFEHKRNPGVWPYIWSRYL